MKCHHLETRPINTLPIAGIETARKLLDKEQPSNDLMPSWATSAGLD